VLGVALDLDRAALAGLDQGSAARRALAAGARVPVGYARQDVLRQVGGEWKIARRRIILDQNVLLAKNVSIFF